jgi:hypothetical protein
MLGSWNVNITVGKFPQKVASALADINTQIVGAEYNPIAYVGSQEVNGVNHAILAEQVLTTGKDVRNIVMLILNEKEDKFTIAGIDRLVEQGAPLGGIQIADNFAVTPDVEQAFRHAIEGYVGMRIEPVALLGTQQVHGTNYILFVQTVAADRNGTVDAAVLVVNETTKRVMFTYVLAERGEVGALSYAFTWLMKQNVALGKPLGEWP